MKSIGSYIEIKRDIKRSILPYGGHFLFSFFLFFFSFQRRPRLDFVGARERRAMRGSKPDQAEDYASSLHFRWWAAAAISAALHLPTLRLFGNEVETEEAVREE